MRVLIVDDQRPFRRVAAAVVNSTAGFEVVGEAETGEHAVDAAARLRPDLVLMDIRLPGIDGVTATRLIRAASPEVIVVLLSTYDPSDIPLEGSDCGAAAFVPKAAFGPQVLLDLFPEVAAGSADGRDDGAD